MRALSRGLPLLSSYAQSHAAQGLTVLAFSLDDPASLPRVRQIAQAFHFPAGLLAQSRAAGYGRIWHIPVNFTIGRDGRLVDDGWQDKRPVWTADGWSASSRRCWLRRIDRGRRPHRPPSRADIVRRSSAPVQRPSACATRIALDQSRCHARTKEIGPEELDERRLILGESAGAPDQPSQAAIG